jgi:serine/threonine-protein kinase RsbW
MPTNLEDKTVEVTVASELGYERIARASAATFAGMIGFSADRIEDVKTMVAEAVINAIQHGNKGRQDARVNISMVFKSDVLHIAVMDSGGGIEELPPKPDIERIIENLDPPIGFGTFIIKQLADEVEFNEMTDGGHLVKMTIKLNP